MTGGKAVDLYMERQLSDEDMGNSIITKGMVQRAYEKGLFQLHTNNNKFRKTFVRCQLGEKCFFITVLAEPDMTAEDICLKYTENEIVTMIYEGLEGLNLPFADDEEMDCYKYCCEYLKSHKG